MDEKSLSPRRFFAKLNPRKREGYMMFLRLVTLLVHRINYFIIALKYIYDFFSDNLYPFRYIFRLAVNCFHIF